MKFINPSSSMHVNKVIIPFLLISMFSILIAGAIVSDFRAQPGLNKVVIKWKSQNETNLKGFEVERSLDDRVTNFKTVKFVAVKVGSENKKEYEFEDSTVFKSLERTYYYRLKIIDIDDSSSYSKVISVSPTISSARQTWGSIKAMFR